MYQAAERPALPSLEEATRQYLRSTCAIEDARMKRICAGLESVVQCNCIGPQNGQPVCPCQMRNVSVVNGRYVKTVDLGPAPQPVEA